jgi:hypothetical protein
MHGNPKQNELRLRHAGQHISIFRVAESGEELQVCAIFPDELAWLVCTLAAIECGERQGGEVGRGRA